MSVCPQITTSPAACEDMMPCVCFYLFFVTSPENHWYALWYRPPLSGSRVPWFGISMGDNWHSNFLDTHDIMCSANNHYTVGESELCLSGCGLLICWKDTSPYMAVHHMTDPNSVSSASEMDLCMFVEFAEKKRYPTFEKCDTHCDNSWRENISCCRKISHLLTNLGLLLMM